MLSLSLSHAHELQKGRQSAPSAIGNQTVEPGKPVPIRRRMSPAGAPLVSAREAVDAVIYIVRGSATDGSTVVGSGDWPGRWGSFRWGRHPDTVITLFIAIC